MAITSPERPRVADRRAVTVPSQQEAPSSVRFLPIQPAGIARVGLQAALGYEWLVSGLDKVLYGRFPATLGGLLTGVLRGGAVPEPFAALLRGVALPQSQFFGWFIEWCETFAGLALLGAALSAILRPLLDRRLTSVARRWMARAFSTVDALALVAAAGTVALGLSFYLLDGAPIFWPTPSIAFGGAIDTGLLLAALATPLALGPALSKLRRR